MLPKKQGTTASGCAHVYGILDLYGLTVIVEFATHGVSQETLPAMCATTSFFILHTNHITLKQFRGLLRKSDNDLCPRYTSFGPKD